MGRYVGNVWHEELADPGGGGVQGNDIPVTSSSQSSTPSTPSTPATPASTGSGGGQLYQTVNGPKTQAQIEAELKAAGWGGGESPFVAYARTAGGTVMPLSGTDGNGVKINSDDMAKLQNFFGQTAGFSREELAEKVRQFNEQMALVERQWEREGKSRLQIDVDMQALRKYQAEQDVAQQRASLGLQYLTTASQMGGPADYYQQSDFLRGAQANSDVPLLLRALATNTSLPAFTGAGATAPAPQTVQGLTAQLTGSAAPTAYNPDQTLAMIGNVFKAGPTGLKPGTLEQFDPNELDLLRSGGRKLGYDPDQWLRAYSRAGIGQAASAPI